MDKALVFGTKDCRFESCQGHAFVGKASFARALLSAACGASGKTKARAQGPLRDAPIAAKREDATRRRLARLPRCSRWRRQRRAAAAAPENLKTYQAELNRCKKACVIASAHSVP